MGYDWWKDNCLVKYCVFLGFSIAVFEKEIIDLCEGLKLIGVKERERGNWLFLIIMA